GETCHGALHRRESTSLKIGLPPDRAPAIPGPDARDWPGSSGDLQCDDPAVVTSASVLGVFTVALALVLTPGPNMMYLVSRSITQGRHAGVISLGGVAVGFLVYLTATNLGLSALFVAVPELYFMVKLAGAYLSLIPELERPAAGHVMLQGFVLGWLAVKLATDHAKPVAA
ncbi:MAG TPA: LysE family translocator, partial [Jatrophihabitantaceae bacterium]|nr:LysE family translocator [Jatrophihabitantaceae bacterium]